MELRLQEQTVRDRYAAGLECSTPHIVIEIETVTSPAATDEIM